MLGIHADQFNKLERNTKKKVATINTPKHVILKTHGHKRWFRWFRRSDDETSEVGEKEKVDDVLSMPPLEGDEEVKEGKALKILTQNKVLTRLLVLLVQIKVGNNSYKLINKIRQILYLSYHHNKVTKKLYNNLIKPL